MENQKVRVRFAPSPTGKLHLGSARTALFNYAFAKNAGGTLVLRIEDTDVKRSTKELETSLMSELKQIGIKWDEGPDAGGPFSPYRQSERFDIYIEYGKKLVDEGTAFHCYCTPEELAEQKERALSEGRPPRYSGRCKRLTELEISKLAETIKPAIRFSIPDYDVLFTDGIRGEISIKSQALGDFVILKGDGSPTYNFAAAVDDRLMEITHVIRGEDHLTNTARQIYIYDALEFNKPEFIHVGMILGTDRAKLSKRHGAKSVGEYLDEGYLPETIVNYLILMGWSDREGKEIFASIDEICSRFSLERLSPSPSIFDPEKFLWMNGEHIRMKDPAILKELCKPFLENAGLNPPSYLETDEVESWLELLSVSFKDNLRTLEDIADLAAPYYDEDIPDYGEFTNELKREPAKEVLEFGLKETHSEQEIDLAAATEITANIRNHFKTLGYKPKDFFHPLRVALVAKHTGPSIPNIFALLGRTRVVERLEYVLTKILRG